MNDKLLKIKFGSLVREIKDFLNLDTEFDLKIYGIEETDLEKIENLSIIIEIVKEIIFYNNNYPPNWNTFGYVHRLRNQALNELIKVLTPLIEKYENKNPKIVTKLKFGSFIREIKDFLRIPSDFALTSYGMEEKDLEDFENLELIIEIANETIKFNNNYPPYWNTYGYFHHKRARKLKEYINFFKNSSKAIDVIDDNYKKLFKNVEYEVTESEINQSNILKSVETNFDVALSFADEDRETAEKIAVKLKNKGFKVFYDNFYKMELVGKDLSKIFHRIYSKNSKYVIIFISKHYSIKDWSNFEFEIALEESKTRKKEFILPIKLDDSIVQGLKRTIGYIDFKKEGIDGIVRILVEKINSKPNIFEEKQNVIAETLVYSDYEIAIKIQSKIDPDKFLEKTVEIYCPGCKVKHKDLKHGESIQCYNCGLQLTRYGNSLECIRRL